MRAWKGGCGLARLGDAVGDGNGNGRGSTG